MKVAGVQYPAADFCVLVLQAEQREWERYIVKTLPQTRRQNGVAASLSPKEARAQLVAAHGERALWYNAINACLDEQWGRLLAQAMRQEKIQPLCMPEFELLQVSAEGFQAAMLCELVPKAELGQYTGMVITPKPRGVEHSEIEAAIQSLWRGSYTLKDTGAPAAAGNELVVLCTPKSGGKAAELQFTLGGREPVPGLGRTLKGHSAGETLRHCPPERKGLPAGEEYQVLIERVCTKEFPPIDDAFARTYSRCGSLQELYAAVQSEHERRALISAIQYEKSHMDVTVGRNLTLHASDYLLQRRVSKRLHGRSAAALLPDMAEEAEEKRKNLLEETARQEVEDKLRARVAMLLVAQAEKLTPGPEEIEREYARLAQARHVSQDIVRRDRPVYFVRQQLAINKAKSFVQKNNKILQGF